MISRSFMFKQSSDVAASSGKIEAGDVELSSGGFLVDAVEADGVAYTAPAGVEIAAEVSGFERLSSVPPARARFRKFRRETSILFSIRPREAKP
jgi:hypothetical protein